MTNAAHRPLLMIYEGIDGIGKSTEARLFRECQQRQPGRNAGRCNFNVVLLEGTWLALPIITARKAERDHLGQPMTQQDWLEVFADGHRQMLHRLIALANTNTVDVVLLDRSPMSTVVYNGMTEADWQSWNHALSGYYDVTYQVLIGQDEDSLYARTVKEAYAAEVEGRRAEGKPAKADDEMGQAELAEFYRRNAHYRALAEKYGLHSRGVPKR